MGTGLATVALGLLAWELAGEDAGAVLGTALAIKMVAYVTLAPVAAAFADRVPRRALLVALDLIRAAVAVPALRDRSLARLRADLPPPGGLRRVHADLPGDDPRRPAGRGRLHQRPVPLRLAYDLERLLSPMLAAALLTVVSFPVLFGGTVTASSPRPRWS